MLFVKMVTFTSKISGRHGVCVQITKTVSDTKNLPRLFPCFFTELAMEESNFCKFNRLMPYTVRRHVFPTRVCLRFTNEEAY